MTPTPLYYNITDEPTDEINSCYIEPQPDLSTMTNLNEEIRIGHLNSEEKREILKLVKQFQDIFYKDGDSLTFTNEVKHKLNTSNDSPIYTKIYRYPYAQKPEVDKQIQEMLDNKIIRHSDSPYNAPIWVVPKKIDASGKIKWRIVIDYRKLNDATKEDKYPIPNIEDLLSKLGKSNYFTVLDLAKGFHQIEIYPPDIEKTAFSTQDGHYEFIRMPFGLKNAPATFQRMMNNVLREQIGKICYVYMDDIVIFSTSLQEHIQSLKTVFQRHREVNLKVQLDKTEFLRKETNLLGHVITPNGIKANPDKIKAIQNYPIPKTLKEIRSFLGITGYYQKFIKDYAKIAKPLTAATRKGITIVHSESFVKCFETLKTLLTSDPILAYPDFNKPFTLTTDASLYALGAILSQEGRPIAYASKTLDNAQCNYDTTERELLAVVWACKQFRHYLYGVKFHLQTDHRALVWLSNLQEPNSKLQRWKIKRNEYNFDIKHIQGKDNIIADALSTLKIVDEINALIRTDITPWQCDICKRYYGHESSLKAHKYSHLKKKQKKILK